MFKKLNKFMFIFIVGIIFVSISNVVFAEEKMTAFQSANISWMLISSALVLLMVPGLAFFYGGMVRTKNILNTLMLSFIALGVMTIQWVVIGYSLAFGEDIMGFVGGFNHLLLDGVTHKLAEGDGIPPMLFMAFQGMFAVITPALISGAIAERMKFSAYVVFIVFWGTFVYDPICHWVWAEGGLFFSGKLGALLFGDDKLAALDFAGGTVVHLSSGISALAAAIILGKRKGYPNEVILPNNLSFTLLGAGLLWFGWFGFNAGSAAASNTSAVLAFTTTFVATAGGAVGWAVAESFHVGKVSALGVASGIVAGLVAVTPAAAFVSPIYALIIGLAGGFICYRAVMMKGKLGYDDSLDVLGIHGVGGTWGAIATGIFATAAAGGVSGLIEGNFNQFAIQIVAVLFTMIYAFVVTYILLKVLDAVMKLRVTADEEEIGLDQTQHGETGYNIH